MSSQIGLEIKLLREQTKLSAKDLAERVGLSPSQMSRLESGQRRVDAVLLSKIAKALGVHPSHFFQDFGPPPSAAGGADGGTGARPDSSRQLVVDSPGAEAAAQLGKLIRAERRKRHLTADELAKKVGKGRAYIQDLEQGKSELVSGDMLVRIAKVLRLDPEALLEAQRNEIRELRKGISRLERAHADRTLGQLELDDPSGAKRGIPIVEAPDGGLPRRFEEGIPEGKVVDYLYVPGLRVGAAFALEWRSDEMQAPTAPSFNSGDLLVFTADRPARHQDFVLAAVDEGATFRQLFLDPKGLRLQPLNLEYPPLILEREDVKELFVLVARVATL